MSKIKKTIFKNIFVFSFVYLINSNNIIVAAEQDKSLKSFFHKNVLTSQKTTENDQTPFKDDPSLKLIADVLPTALSPANTIN